MTGMMQRAHTGSLLLAALVSVVMSAAAAPVMAQNAAPGPASAVPATTPPPAQTPAPEIAPGKSAFQSGGLSASINSVTIIHKNDAVIEFVLRNITNSKIYLVAFGTDRASTDIGIVGVANGTDVITGINTCFISNDTDAYSYEQCLNSSDGIGKDINKYSYLEHGESVVVSMRYDFSEDISAANTISFAFKAITRPVAGDLDSLSDAEAVKAVGRPHVVNINFPLISIKSGS
jgi:hypothetical protein